MKKIYSIVALILVLCLGFVGCQEQNPPVENPSTPDTQLSDTVFVISSQASTIKVDLTTTTGDSWRVLGNAPWCSVSPKTGNGSHTIEFKVNENTTYDDRTYTWTVEAINMEAVIVQKVTYTVRILQKAKNAIVISEPTISTTHSAKNIEIPVSTNGQLLCQITEGAEWLSVVEPENSKALRKEVITLKATANTSQTETRKAVLSIGMADGSLAKETITITQSPAPDPGALPNMLTFQVLKANNTKLATDLTLESITSGHDVDTIRLNSGALILDLNLKATFTHNAVSASVGGVEVVTGTTALDYGAMQEFTLNNGVGVHKYVVIVRQFTGLPIVYINTKDGAPIVSKDDYLTGTVRFVENAKEGSKTLLDVPTQVKGRGNSTWGQPKKPYKLKLNSKASVFGFAADKEWVLLANYLDASLLKNDLAFEVSSRTKLDYTPNRKFVEVVLNGKHNGNYLLTDQIKISTSRVDVEAMKTTDTSPDKISGGYLLEFDTYYDEDWKFKSAVRGLPVMVKEPDIVQVQLDWLINYFKEVENTIYGENFKDPQNGYAKYIDVDSWIDWWILYETMGNYEPNHPKSVYMHKKRDGKLVMGPAWDFDYTEFSYKTDRFYMKGAGGSSKATMPLYYERLLQDPVFNKKLKDRYAELRKGPLSNVNIYLKAQELLLKASVGYDYTLWHSGSNYTSEFNKVYNFTVNHLNWLDKNIASL